MLKKQFGDDILVITDVCLCAYTTDGHCGLSRPLAGRTEESLYVDNDASVSVLARMALAHARAGADMVAPSDMMDGRVKAIRELLDAHRLEHIPRLFGNSLCYYGPFREHRRISTGTW
jgi:porphobilinogen synthase